MILLRKIILRRAWTAFNIQRKDHLRIGPTKRLRAEA